ncbi:Cycloartenol-C-24-methyltransferase 1 [Diplonema papillatum]|nr:Cycloartenol-C-24-methyltransferase 1 [Diplonema papillatum]
MLRYFAAMAVAAILYLMQQPTPVDDMRGMREVLYSRASPQKFGGTTSDYHNMVIDYYQYGWGQTFHFAHSLRSDGFDATLQKHQIKVADLLEVGAGSKVLECGCGIGDAARQVVARTGAFVKGVTENEYEVARAVKVIEAYGLSSKTEVVLFTFSKIPDGDETFDAVYSIEGTSRAPSLEVAYREVSRVLKPGGRFVVFEWLRTPKFNSKNATHAKYLDDIEYYNGVPDIRAKEDIVKAAAAAGLSIVSDSDLALDTDGAQPWFHRLEVTPVKKAFSRATTYFSELSGALPKGALSVQNLLWHAAEALHEAGEEGLITPLHLFVMKKAGEAQQPTLTQPTAAAAPAKESASPGTTDEEL